MNINVNGSDSFVYRNRKNQNPFLQNTLYPHRDSSGTAAADRATPYEAMAHTNSLIDQSLSYAESLQASRASSQNTSLAVKKLRYDFKALSTQILRSKTSANARQVAGSARREVIRLKRKRQEKDCDNEALQSAIVHAQAMERAARKKARHLEEEEMVKVTGGPCAGELEEQEALKEQSLEDATAEAASEADDNMPVSAEEAAAAMEELQAMMELQTEEMQLTLEEMGSSMEDLLEELSASMEELLEDSGLEELQEGLFASYETEMDPADYKMMKLKHRAKELKDITKADMEYLKDLFDRLERAKSSCTSAMPGLGSGAASALSSGRPAFELPNINIKSAPDLSGTASASAPAAIGSLDICV